MSKSSKCKKSKVPKLTEAEYAAYITSLKTEEEGVPTSQRSTLAAEGASVKRVEE